MKETNLFQSIDTIPLYNDSIGNVTLYDASHANESEEQRIWTVTTIASLAYGRESAISPEALYERMKSIKHESLWEFIREGFIGSRRICTSMRMSPESFDPNISYTAYKCAPSYNENIACFRIKVPIFVARQFMRHRSFSYLEMSRRYTKDSKVPFEFWFHKECSNKFRANLKLGFMEDYGDMIDAGYHTQVASRFLPQTTYTEFYVMGEVEGLKNFFTLRCAKEAQEEIREVAMAMLKLIAKHQPELYKKVLP